MIKTIVAPLTPKDFPKLSLRLNQLALEGFAPVVACHLAAADGPGALCVILVSDTPAETQTVPETDPHPDGNGGSELPPPEIVSAENTPQ